MSPLLNIFVAPPARNPPPRPPAARDVPDAVVQFIPRIAVCPLLGRHVRSVIEPEVPFLQVMADPFVAYVFCPFRANADAPLGTVYKVLVPEAGARLLGEYSGTDASYST